MSAIQRRLKGFGNRSTRNDLDGLYPRRFRYKRPRLFEISYFVSIKGDFMWILGPRKPDGCRSIVRATIPFTTISP